jgi:lysophospholipase L1-like esterase
LSKRPLTLAWLVVPPLLALAGAAVIGAPFAHADASTVDYVALGDSYSSGLGTPGTSGACARGPGGFASLWATDQQPASFQLLACTGATTDDVLRSQLSGLNADTDLVSITIGGNDAGFFPAVVACATGSDAACAQQVAVGRGIIQDTLPGKLENTFRAIRDRAPAATVVVLGYPRLLDPTGTCSDEVVSIPKRAVLNTAADELDQVIGTAAKVAGVTFVDVRDRFAGHGICTTVPWINNLSAARAADSFHPNGAGNERGYLQALNGAFSAARG